jgi:2-isopropylmalate synthase
MTDKIIIFDTTLRDGEQSPGYSMNIAEKMYLASQLEKLRVDVLEAGFPSSSEGDY